MKQKLFKSAFIYMLLMSFGMSGYAQNTIRVSGKIIDSQGEPIIGATVLVRGISTGTISDLDGNFTINAKPDATLDVTYIGYKTQSIHLNGQTIIKITLEESVQTLAETVVVGYGTIKRENVLGSVASVSAKEIEDLPAMNIGELLQGRLPGLHIGQNTGKPGSNVSYSIRKNTSYATGAQQVLYIIDDIIYENSDVFNLLDPSEIESISVLKDAATAVYGARAAGGAIVVKTRKGEIGKTRIAVSGSWGFNDATMMPEMLSGYEHANILNFQKHIAAGKYDPKVSEQSYLEKMQSADLFSDDELEAIKGLNYNWLENEWRPSANQRYTINISGGTEKTRYFVGGAYRNQGGNFGNLSVNQFNIRAGIETEVIAGLKASLTIDSNYKSKEAPYNQSDSGNTETMRSTFQVLLQTPRWIPSYINGYPVTFYDPNKRTGPIGSNGQINHPGALNSSGSKDTSNQGSTNFIGSLSYTFKGALTGLSAQVSGAIARNYSNQLQYRKGYYMYYFPVSGTNGHLLPAPTDNILPSASVWFKNNERISHQADFGNNYQANGTLSYQRTFANAHNVAAFVTGEIAGSEGEGFQVFTDKDSKMLFDNYIRLKAFDGVYSAGDSKSKGFRAAVVGRVNYDYLEKYLLEASFRYEGSVKFPPYHRWGLFYSIAGGWRISEEDFWINNISFIDYFKIRANYGLLGDDRVGARQWEYAYDLPDTQVYLGGSQPSRILVTKNSGLVNGLFTWEKTQSYNIGIDSRWFNHIDFSIDGWFKHTYDILDVITSELPYTSGIDKSPAENYGIINGWGGEMSIGYTGEITKDFKYTVRANFDTSDDYVIKKKQALANIGTWRDELGKRTDRKEAYQAGGIIKNQEELDQLNASWNEKWGHIYPRHLEPGMIWIKDVGGPGSSTEPDGEINEDDALLIYRGNPYGFGFGFGLQYKSLRVDATFTGGFGGKTIIKKDDLVVPSDALNAMTVWRDYWTEDNQDASMPRPYSDWSLTYESTFWMRSATQLQLKNINISYALPQKYAQKMNIRTARIFVNALNLWTIIDPYGFKDPSMSFFNSYPLMRSLNIGLNLDI